MKYRTLVWAGLWRKPLQTILTTLSVAVVFLLFGALRGMSVGLDVVIDGMSADRMRVQSRASFREPLPLSYLGQIERVPGVSRVGYVTVFDSYFQDPRNAIVAVASGGAVFASKPPEFTLPKDQEAAFHATRTGAVVGARLAERYGWKIGDRVPLHSTVWTRRDGSAIWIFDVVGIYDVTGRPALAQEFYLNYDYFDQERTTAKGTVNLFSLRGAAPPRVAAAIDDLFANSSNPTLTQTDREWVRSQQRQVGDINFVMNAIVGAALFTLLFLTWNTMTRSVRERIPEIAVLKAVGFSDTKVMALVVVEALALCAFGSLLGLAAARGIFSPMSMAMQAPISMPTGVAVTGIAVALATAGISAAVPSWRARRLSIVDALAGR